MGKPAIMSDDEYDRMSQTSQTSMKGDEAFAKRKAGVQKNELNEQLKEYIGQWREERQKEESELMRLKEKQAKRKRRKQRKQQQRKSKWKRPRSNDKKCWLHKKKRVVSSLLVLPWMLTRSWPKQKSKLRRNAKFLLTSE